VIPALKRRAKFISTLRVGPTPKFALNIIHPTAHPPTRNPERETPDAFFDA